MALRLLAGKAVLTGLTRCLGVVCLGLAACAPDPINSPHQAGAGESNTLYSAFFQRSPKYLDPAMSYSSDESPFTYAIYEPLYGYHYLKRPYELVPKAALALAEPVYFDASGRELPADAPGSQVAESRYDIRIQPGILYQPHPAFARGADGHPVYWPITTEQLAGKYAIGDFEHQGTRELVAHDYVYGLKRLASPRVASPIYELLANHIVGMRAYGDRLRAHDARLRSEGDAPEWLDLRTEHFDGVQALDEHTLRIRVLGKYPQFKYWLAMTFTAPVPWEADRFYHQPGMSRRNLSLNTWPVGTGPYMLAESQPNHRHVLRRNPYYRGVPYPCEGEPGDEAAGLLADCGQPMPFIDEVVFSLEKESVPLLGKFLQGYYDIPDVATDQYGVAMRVAAGDSAEKAALYRDRGLQLQQATAAQLAYLAFNWRDPVVGRGDTPEQQRRNRLLRQALAVAIDWEQFVAIFRSGEGEVAHGPIPPGIEGYAAPPHSVQQQVYRWVDGRVQRRSLDDARALLGEAGYPDGRDALTGQPLVLYFDSAGGLGGNALTDWLRRQVGELGIQLEVRATDYNRFQEKIDRGTTQMFMFGWLADYPDAENFLFLLYGPNAAAEGGGANAANYQNPEYDQLFEAVRYLDEGSEKKALVARMVALLQDDLPWLFGYFPHSGGVYQPWVHNAKPSQMVRDTLQYYRLDTEQRAFLQAEWNRPVWWPALLMLAGLLAFVAGMAWWVRRRGQRTALGTQARPAAATQEEA